VGAALGVLLVVVLLAWLGQGDEPSSTPNDTPSASADSPSDSPSPSPTRTRAPGIVIRAEDYVGLPEDEAKSRLEDLGLKVKEEKVENLEGRPENTVADIDPTGRVSKGDEITLSLWGKPVVEQVTPSQPHGKGKNKGHEKKGH
jgi:hypothetical protein